MRDKKRFLLAGTLATMMFVCAACGKTDNEQPEAAETTREESTDVTETPAAGEATSTWTAGGNYVDEALNHLMMYETSVEFGYDKDGWGAMLTEGDKMYSGPLDEVDGNLTGTISVYSEDGSATDTLNITLVDMGGYIKLIKDTGEEMQFLPDEADYIDENFLPMFYYNDVLADISFQPLEAAAYDYLAFDHVENHDTSNVLIPYVQIVDLDETNPDDELLYGDYWVWEFEKQGDTLVAVSGGHCPGIIHLERFGDGESASYSAIGKMDEAFTDDDAKKLFGDYYDHYVKLSSDDELRESSYAQIIADYVAKNDLDITKYQIGGEEAKELPETRVKHVTADLPAYEYPGPEVYYHVLYDYLVESFDFSSSDSEACIPCPIIVYEDMSNKDDILVYGDFWVNSYYLDGDIMKETSGGSFPGCIHMKQTDSGYEVTGMDRVEDGSSYEPTAKKIFGKYYEEFIKTTSDTEKRDEIRAQIIANYVAANNLNVTAIQDYGWDPIPLPEENIDTFYSDLN